jgi:8-oxo-dGTP diphosphatase
MKVVEAVSTHICGWIVLQRADGLVLLARRSGVHYGEGLWGLPGGHAGHRESWADAAAREVREEVGVTIAVDDLTPLGVQRYVDGKTHGVDAYFLATNWLGEPSAVSECSEVDWFDVEQLPGGTRAGAKCLHRLLTSR